MSRDIAQVVVEEMISHGCNLAMPEEAYQELVEFVRDWLKKYDLMNGDKS